MIKNIVPHLVAVATFVALSVAFFSPQLQGRVLRQGDIVQNRAMANEHRTYQKELGEPILWTNAMFGGMPTYQISTNTQGNNLKYAEKSLRLGFDRPIGYFIASMICFYILMMSLNVNPWIALAGAIAFGFTTNNYILFEAGHNTKIQSVAYIPLIAAGMINAFRQKYWLGGLLFALGVGLNVYANHIQMTYYFGLTLIVYGIVQLVIDAKNGKILDFAKAVGVLLVAGIIGVGACAVNMMTTYEYSQDTMRGAPILEQSTETAQASSSSSVEGLDWQYAMNWSNGTIDLFSTFIPRVVGGASGETLGSESATYKALSRRGAQLGGSLPVPLYWGKLNSTAGPPYFGAIIVFLFILGLFIVKGPVKWWLGLGVLLTMMISMGKHLEWFNHFLFDNLPLFNKFRTPNSVLSVTAAMAPILGMLALMVINKNEIDRKTLLRQLYIATGITAGIAAIFALLGSSLFDFSAAGDANLEQLGYDLNAVKEDRATYMRSDAFRSLGLVIVAAALLWAFLTEKIKFVWVAAGIAVMTFLDLWTVNRRYIQKDEFVTQRNYENAFTPRAVDQQIMNVEKNRGAYRVFDVSTRTNPFENASTSYHHNTIGGYHPAKLQRIQDVVDYHLSGSFNQKVLDMFNTKYFIVGGQEGPQLQQNPAALGNAWFVDTINMVANANAEIEGLSNFNPATQAVVHSEFKDYLSGFDPNGQGSITMDVDAYRPDQLTYQSNSNSEQLAVFSEVWYGPDKGWKAYIDGKEVEHIRVNYILRALRIPAGQHKVEFIFEPSSFYTGKTISMICSLLILLGLLGYIAYFLPPKLKELQTAEVVETPAKPITKKAAPKSKRKKR
ncbi:MAG: YfhO family protein [Bacteroidota bacterium]